MDNQMTYSNSSDASSQMAVNAQTSLSGASLKSDQLTQSEVDELVNEIQQQLARNN